VQILVAAGNAVGMGIAAWLLGLPLAIPIAVVVFLASFIPVAGALFAVPFVATLNVMVRHIAGGSGRARMPAVGS
jgi:predicted PurR-regulated permease PerM